MMYPAMLNIEGKKINIIGGGQVAYRKAKMFLAFGGEVRVIAPCLYEKFEEIADEIKVEKTAFYLEDLDEKLKDSFIVVAATDDTEINEAIGMYCKEKNKLCNVIDNKSLSSFIVPAYMQRGNLVISVSTGGKSPFLAKKIKKELEETYGKDYEVYTHLLGKLREHIKMHIRDEEEKRKLLAHLTTLDLEELKLYEESYYSR